MGNWLGVIKVEFIAMSRQIPLPIIIHTITHFHIALQFVELKGSVFKKFDKNNLFQVSCSDVRERFHLFSLLFIVVVQTMKEYGWREGKIGFWLQFLNN